MAVATIGGTIGSDTVISMPKGIPVRDPSIHFWTQVDVRSEEECWPWTGARHKSGYGKVTMQGKTWLTHVFAYQDAFEERPMYPEGDRRAGKPLPIDHQCHSSSLRECPGGSSCTHRRCCNPWHLRAVTAEENNRGSHSITSLCAAQTHCKRGHELTEDNVYRPPADPTERVCRSCRRIREAQYRAARRG